MLQPFEFAILTQQDAEILVEFIIKQTASKSSPINYKKMGELKVLNIYEQLMNFIESKRQYDNNLKSLDSGRLVYNDD